jgi:hypothetical protein
VNSTPGANFEALEKIANAVLYEGFLLYPYRKSSVKNQHRWHFGTVGAAGSQYPTSMRTECLVEGGDRTLIDLKIRFLMGEAEQAIEVADIPLRAEPIRGTFQFGPIECAVEIESARVSEGLFRFIVRIANLSGNCSDNCAMCSVHTMLAVRDGAFVSLTDPPEECRVAAAECRNIGTWPVLAGREGERNLVLSSPIILYDYPQIAPESSFDFHDGTEIDEMLTLRVLTLSEDEKREVREAGQHGRDILERTESLPQEVFAKMHGAIRGLRTESKPAFREGDRVRLHPRRKADIFDIALEGKIAVVETVERDFEDNVHLAVTVEDDPGRDLGAARQIGHRFFFRPEEVELV